MQTFLLLLLIGMVVVNAVLRVKEDRKHAGSLARMQKDVTAMRKVLAIGAQEWPDEALRRKLQECVDGETHG